MRPSFAVLALAAVPALLAAQTPVITSGATAKAIGAATVTMSSSTPDGGGPANAKVGAEQTLLAIRSVCTLVENDGKLFAACDNTKPEARALGSTRVPQIATEWELFASRLSSADQIANNKRRAIVILNQGEVVAEVNAAGHVMLKR
jgi:hypothetical protein